MNRPSRILVIRLGALGDLVLCFQAFHEIRQAHPGAEIAFLTMPQFADFSRTMPWFDKVIIDERAPLSQFGKWWALITQIRAFNPTRIYDLQGKLRQNILYFLLGCPKGWSGAAPFCQYPRPWPPQPAMHFTDFIAAQLRAAGVPVQPPADLSWCDASLEEFSLLGRYAVLIPGCAPGRDYKRWPAAAYADLVARLRKTYTPIILVGTKADADAIDAIKHLAPDVLDFSGQTNLRQLAAIFRHSACVIGNDTGPTHLAAAVGAPTVALMPGEVNAAWAAPKGVLVESLKGDPLGSLPVREVLLALDCVLDKSNAANTHRTKDRA